MAQHVISVSQLNEYIQRIVDGDSFLSNIAVKGEISNYKIYPSGHHYFTVKDSTASLKCVMFRSSAVKLKFRPENGMQIIAMGRISVYPRDGAYQLYCTAMAQDGVGDLHAAFEQMKKKLDAQGLFDPMHKKAIPKHPERIGVITSSAGAAVHDMIRILRKRYPLTKVLLLPVRVQGAEAPVEIVAAIRYANYHKLADLLIVGRGGGSMEDLWAFNDEGVANAIYDSEIPVISAVGHEPDVTISDYVADLRAATPSNAAELAVPDQDNLRQALDAMMGAMSNAVLRQLRTARRQLDALSERPALQSPLQSVQQRKKKMEYLTTRLLFAQRGLVNKKKNLFVALTSSLDAMSPLKVLIRGYAVVRNDDGLIVRSKQQVQPGEHIHITLHDGQMQATVD